MCDDYPHYVFVKKLILIISVFAVLSMFTSVLFFCCQSQPPKESALSILDLDPKNATFETVIILGMKTIDSVVHRLALGKVTNRGSSGYPLGRGFT